LKDLFGFRIYLDSVEEQISAFANIHRPPKYIVYTPSLFNAWSDWAQTYREPVDGKIRPLGEKVGPAFCRWEFDGLEDFYQYYKEIIEEANG